ncbi:hypothetical protein IV203_022128 [Nitzschia inconspicua]|uniref:Uncharacterized protein n=1 Tax=Nitzschia inconspicua TaxID=303405 RepID=A0A9K3KI53_9STRA|nr:hypothetical protein IV203_022128 [Nitzschia inconspicua]
MNCFHPPKTLLPKKQQHQWSPAPHCLATPMKFGAKIHDNGSEKIGDDWEEENSVSKKEESITETTTTTKTTTESSQPPWASQLFTLLVDWSNADTKRMNVLEGWKESISLVNPTKETNKDQTNSNNSFKKSFPNQTIVDAWKESWLVKEETVPDVGDHIWRYLIGDWSKLRRNYILLSAIRAVCVAVLAWECVAMTLTSLTVSGLWAWTYWTQPTIFSWQQVVWYPIQQYQKVLFSQAYRTLILQIDPIIFVLKALGTLVILPYYENLVCTVESFCFSREHRARYPLISRLQGLLGSFFLAFGLIQILTIMGIYVGTCFGFAKHWLIPTSKA